MNPVVPIHHPISPLPETFGTKSVVSFGTPTATTIELDIVLNFPTSGYCFPFFSFHFVSFYCILFGAECLLFRGGFCVEIIIVLESPGGLCGFSIIVLSYSFVQKGVRNSADPLPFLYLSLV